MSRFLTRNPDGTYLEEIESMEECKFRMYIWFYYK